MTFPTLRSRAVRCDLAATAVTLFVLATPAFAAVEVGDKITESNMSKIKDIVSPGVQWCVGNGMEMDIVEYEPIPTPVAYRAATEKYSGQVTLGDDNMVKNWVAGKPFPAVDNNDPQAAQKIMYNFERTHYSVSYTHLTLPTIYSV